MYKKSSVQGLRFESAGEIDGHIIPDPSLDKLIADVSANLPEDPYNTAHLFMLSLTICNTVVPSISRESSRWMMDVLSMLTHDEQRMADCSMTQSHPMKPRSLRHLRNTATK